MDKFGDNYSKLFLDKLDGAHFGVAEDMLALAELYEIGDGCPKSISDATLWYYRAACRGMDAAIQKLQELCRISYDAQYRLALYNEKKDCYKSVELYSELALHGDRRGLLALTRLSNSGNSFATDRLDDINKGSNKKRAPFKETVDRHLILARNGSYESLQLLSKLVIDGKIQGDYVTAVSELDDYYRRLQPEYADHLMKAITDGNDELLDELIEIFKNGNRAAIKQIKLLYDQGYWKEGFQKKMLDLFLREVKNGSFDALSLLEAIANRGNADIYVELGSIYEDEQGHSYSLVDACRYYSRAFLSGRFDLFTKLKEMATHHTDISFEIAQLFYQCSESGNYGPFTKNDLLNEADRFLFRAAESGDSKSLSVLERKVNEGDVNAIVALASMHEVGLGVDKSYVTAFSLYKRAIRMGHREYLNRIEMIADIETSLKYELALFFEEIGIGTRARSIYHVLAVAGDERALEKFIDLFGDNVSMMHEIGRIIEKNKTLEEAQIWYKASADSGNVISMLKMSLISCGTVIGSGGLNDSSYWMDKAISSGSLSSLSEKDCNVFSPQDLYNIGIILKNKGYNDYSKQFAYLSRKRGYGPAIELYKSFQHDNNTEVIKDNPHWWEYNY